MVFCDYWSVLVLCACERRHPGRYTRPLNVTHTRTRAPAPCRALSRPRAPREARAPARARGVPRAARGWGGAAPGGGAAGARTSVGESYNLAINGTRTELEQ